MKRKTKKENKKKKASSIPHIVLIIEQIECIQIGLLKLYVISAFLTLLMSAIIGCKKKNHVFGFEHSVIKCIMTLEKVDTANELH